MMSASDLRSRPVDVFANCQNCEGCWSSPDAHIWGQKKADLLNSVCPKAEGICAVPA